MSTRTSKPKSRAARAARELMSQDPALTYNQALQQVRAARAARAAGPSQPRYRLTPDHPVEWVTNPLGENVLLDYGPGWPERMTVTEYQALGFTVGYWDSRGSFSDTPTGTPHEQWYPLTRDEQRYNDDAGNTWVSCTAGFTRTVDGHPVKVLLPDVEIDYRPDEATADDDAPDRGREQVLAWMQRFADAVDPIVTRLGGYTTREEDLTDGGTWPFHRVTVVAPLPAVMDAYPNEDDWFAVLAAAVDAAGGLPRG